LPLIISSGGNSGSQATTLVIRAMALGELRLRDWFSVVRKELLSGLALGLILGIIGFFRITLWQYLHIFDYGKYHWLVALTVGSALIGVVLWGTLSGAMLPFLLRRCGLDPAASSAPFVATLVDVTGLVIYFNVALFVLRGTLLCFARCVLLSKYSLYPSELALIYNQTRLFDRQLQFIQIFDHFLHTADHERETIVIKFVGRVVRRVIVRITKRRGVGYHDGGVTMLPE